MLHCQTFVSFFTGFSSLAPVLAFKLRVNLNEHLLSDDRKIFQLNSGRLLWLHQCLLFCFAAQNYNLTNNCCYFNFN